MILSSHSHLIAVTEEEEEEDEFSTYTTEIGNKTNPFYQLRVRDDPEVEIALEAIGISKHRSYINEDGRTECTYHSYTVNVFNAEEAEYIVQKFEEILPELFDDNNKEYVSHVITESTDGSRRKRSTARVGIHLCWKIIELGIRILIKCYCPFPGSGLTPYLG